MMAAPTVRVSGIVLSSLMFQHVNGDGDVEGLVLGESKFEEQVTISDSQADHIHIEETYSKKTHRIFYNSVGDIDMEERVIGWYRQRRNTDQVMSFREKVVHENLKTSLSNPHMIFVLLTPSKLTPPGSTHKMEYAAFISRSRHFINVPILVNNLGVLEQLAYWKVSASCSATSCRLRSKFFSSNGLLREVNEVNDMNESLQAELQVRRGVCVDVEESERRLETLQSYAFSVWAELEKDLPEQKNNLLLQDAVRTLFARSPLFQTQILTLQAFPVPHVHCGSEQDDAVSVTPQDSQSPLNATRTNGWKRQKETSEGKDRKRRKNQL
uniref:Abraxas 1, BRCA1 A complex subunit n=1 Tax=Echeneis naucrates TaxID=173247 RepID=A0A665THT2_ECHNA